ncbi:hypothetical protein SRHO_G00054280 [Serrasalmus rhombeus]
MGSSFCSKGFLLFLLLQMSLPSCVRGETSTVSSDPTSSAMTEINTATDVPTSMTTLSAQTSNFTSPNTVSTMSMTNITLNVTMTNNVTITTNGTALSTDSNSTNTSNVSISNLLALGLNNQHSETCLYATITNLLNVTMMSMTSTTQSTTTTTKATTTVTTTAPTNGKKCHKISCNGDTCYQGNTNVVLCSPTQNYCMLKKATSGTVVTWTGGCSEDCSKETACSSTTSTCFLECCNATTTASCLKLTGAVNMPSSATRGLFSPMLLMACSLFLWIISMDSSA